MTIYSANDLGAAALRLQTGSPVFAGLLAAEAIAQNFLATEGGGDRPFGGGDRSHQKDRLRHILLGSPEEIRQAIHQLHVLNYVEPILWSPIMAVGNRLVITPEQGEAMSLLRR